MPAGLASLVLQSQVFFTVAIAGMWLGEPGAGTTSPAWRLRPAGWR